MSFQEKLFNPAFINLTSSDETVSFKILEKLGMKKITEEHIPATGEWVTDGSVLISCQKQAAGIGLGYFCENPDLMGSYFNLNSTQIKYGIVKSSEQHFLFVPNIEGISISIMKRESLQEFKLPLPVLMTMSEDDIIFSDRYPNPVCGVFSEISIPVETLTQSIDKFEHIGFVTKELHRGPYPNAVMTDGLHVIGLHQTDDFSTAAITFAAPDMSSRVERLDKTVMDRIEPFYRTGFPVENWKIILNEKITIFLLTL